MLSKEECPNCSFSERGRMYYVYIIKLINNQHYIGFTSNLKQRIIRHRTNSVVTTKRIKPKKLLFYAAFSSKQKALDFEKYLKSSSGFAFRNKRLI
jgi:putative endonuclease